MAFRKVLLLQSQKLIKGSLIVLHRGPFKLSVYMSVCHIVVG